MAQTAIATLPQRQSPFAVMASRLNIDENETKALMTNTLMQAKKDRNGNPQQVTNEELVTFLAIANEYSLNPLTKEIYAFNNRGAIQPIVSIDGWLKIINQHPQFDGMEFVDRVDGGSLTAVTCRIYRKDRTRPTEVTEYMNECAGTSEPWKKWPARMLRHKATIQAARYAFGLSGIVDPDEAERIEQTARTERDVTPASNTSLSAKLEQPKQAPAAAMPDFGEPEPPAPAPVAELLKHLPACTTEQDLEEWKTEALRWPTGSAEQAELVAAYKAHKLNLAHAATHQEG